MGLSAELSIQTQTLYTQVHMKKCLALFFTALLCSTFIGSPVYAQEAFTLLRDTEGTLVNAQNIYNPTEVAKTFYAIHPEDRYDFLLVATTFDIANKPNYQKVWQPDVSSGEHPYDARSGYGIPSQKLLGILSLKNIESFPTDYKNVFFQMDWWRTVVHEFGHNWLVYLQHKHRELLPWLKENDGHWDKNALLPSTIMGGNQQQYWSRTGTQLRFVGTPIEGEANLIFDPLALYLMSFGCAEQARGTEYWLTNGTDGREARLEGTLNVQELERVLGPQSPNCRSSQKDFRVGLILLETPTHPATTAHRETMQRLASWIPAWWHDSTQGMSRMDTGASLPLCRAADYEEKFGSCENGKRSHTFIKKQPCLGGDDRTLYEVQVCSSQTKTSQSKTLVVTPPTISLKEQSGWIVASGRDLDGFLRRLGTNKRVEDQRRWFAITTSLLKTRTPAPTATLYAVNNYIVYGIKVNTISPTQRLERVKKFITKFKRYPVNQKDWEQVI